MRFVRQISVQIAAVLNKIKFLDPWSWLSAGLPPHPGHNCKVGYTNNTIMHNILLEL